MNPLRAKIVSDIKGLNKYPYSGQSVLMGKKKQKWCDTEYVLSYFGKKVSEARKSYLLYVKKGIDQGRRPELVGGGLVRSLGGWSAVKKLRLKGQEGMSCTDVAKRLRMSQPGVGYAVSRGEKIAKKHKYQLHE